MNFVNPTFLYALAALAIPVIIHLFYFRRYRKVYFTNVKFLKEVKQEQATRNRIKHWLVLLARLLALACLVLAFAQPFIPKDESEVIQGNKNVSIYLDNSFSMQDVSNDVSLFAKAKKKAQEIIAAYGPDDKFQLLTNDFLGKHQRLLSKEEFVRYLEEVEITPNVRTLSEVFKRQKQALSLEEADQDNVFLLTDFQKNIVDFENDTTINVFFVPLQSVAQHNVYIDSVWFDSPIKVLNQPNKILVQIKNTGDTDVTNSKMDLNINGQRKSFKNFNIKANSKITDTLNFTITQTGWHKAHIAISDYPINFDDSYYFTFEVAEKINVLAINQASPNQYLNALFKGAVNVDTKNQSVNQLEYAKFPTYQLIILNQLKNISSGLSSELQQYVRDGGSLVVFPNDNMAMDSYNKLLKGLRVNTYNAKSLGEQYIDKIATKHEIFTEVFEKIPRNVDLPFANISFTMTDYARSGQRKILRFKGGASAMSAYRVGKGKVYVSAVSLNKQETNLPAHAIFVPMVYKMALVSGQAGQLAYTIGKNQVIEVDNKATKKETVFKLKGEEEEVIPGQKIVGSKLLLTLNNQLKESGIYQLYMNENSPLYHFGFNFNRQESILELLNLDQLKEKYTFPNVSFINNPDEELTDLVSEYDKGWVLWQWCLLAALGFLLLEIILLRVFR